MKIDPHSATWAAVREYAESRLAEHRTRLEGNLDWEDTLCVRAQMKEVRRLLAEVEPADAQYVALDIQQQE